MGLLKRKKYALWLVANIIKQKRKKLESYLLDVAVMISPIHLHNVVAAQALLPDNKIPGVLFCLTKINKSLQIMGY
jgi:hypothetical protein